MVIKTNGVRVAPWPPANYLELLADELEKAGRMGGSEDVPEGNRYIQLSDTLAKQIIGDLRMYVPKIEVRAVSCDCGCDRIYVDAFMNGKRMEDFSVDVAYGILSEEVDESATPEHQAQQKALWKWFSEYDAPMPD